MERLHPPADISPAAFFLEWVPAAVAKDPARQAKLAGVEALIEFDLSGTDGGSFAIRVADGNVTGSAVAVGDADLRVELSVETWRRLNSGEVTAPEALLRRDLKFTGSFLLGLKLHLILG